MRRRAERRLGAVDLDSGGAADHQAKVADQFVGAHALAAEGFCSGGSKRGREALGEEVSVADGLDEALVSLAYDAETSGGLLIAVNETDAQALESALTDRGVLAVRIGAMVEGTGAAVELC